MVPFRLTCCVLWSGAIAAAFGISNTPAKTRAKNLAVWPLFQSSFLQQSSVPSSSSSLPRTTEETPQQNPIHPVLSLVEENNDENSSTELEGKEGLFDIFVKMRTGLGNGPGSSNQVYLSCTGTLHSIPSGNVLALVEGFDATRGERTEDGRVRQLTRKMFWFRHPNTGEIMTEYEGNPVRTIRYDYQVIELERKMVPGAEEEMIQPTVTRPKVIPCMPITGRCIYANDDEQQAPRQIIFTAPVFIDAPIPASSNNGTTLNRYRAWEMYDFIVDPSFSSHGPPPTLTFTRQGPFPAFVPTGTHEAVMHCTAKRVSSFEELPKSYQDFVLLGDDQDLKMFCNAPLNMDEIDQINQKTIPQNPKQK